MEVRVVISESLDPWLNLAVENYLFREMGPDQQVLFLWRNLESVIIGRFQNPWSECDLGKMEREGVALVRRQSGGGAVFHDLGNTNFTLMSRPCLGGREVMGPLVCGALEDFGLSVRQGCRGDFWVEGKGEEWLKVSGSASRRVRDRCFHHGTLLISADLAKLRSYLNPGKKDFRSRGIPSVPSPVANLGEWVPTLTHESFCEVLGKRLKNSFGKASFSQEVFPTSTTSLCCAVERERLRLGQWSWCFGETPPFEHHMEGLCSRSYAKISLYCRKGCIERASISLGEGLKRRRDCRLLEESLRGKPYGERAGIWKAVEASGVGELLSLGEFMVGQMS